MILQVVTLPPQIPLTLVVAKWLYLIVTTVLEPAYEEVAGGLAVLGLGMP
ncbi:hypothetical protein [Adhaeribacter aquaticus]|nr:hypothetical protein [Adhaeribacter aquaticus]